MMVAVSLYLYPLCAYTFILRSFLNAAIVNLSLLSHPSDGFPILNNIGIVRHYAIYCESHCPSFPMFMVILCIGCMLVIQSNRFIRIKGLLKNYPLMFCVITSYFNKIFFLSNDGKVPTTEQSLFFVCEQ